MNCKCEENGEKGCNKFDCPVHQFQDGLELGRKESIQRAANMFTDMANKGVKVFFYSDIMATLNDVLALFDEGDFDKYKI